MIPNIKKYPALIIHKSKHFDAFYLITDKEEYLNCLFSLFTDVFKLHEIDYGFRRKVEVDLFNNDDFEKHPWKKMENVKDVCSFYFEAYELALKEEYHELTQHLDEEKYINPALWKNACILMVFKYFGEEIEIDRFENR